MHEWIARLTPSGRVPALNLAYTIQDRLPKISEDHKWAHGHRFFVEHLPNDGKFHQRSRSSLAGDITVAEPYQLK